MRHTKRLFLIPEEIFQTFTQQQQEIQDGTPIGMVRARMRQIENDDILSGGVKAAKYEQEFKRLSKLTKDDEERPVGVRLQNLQEISDLLPQPPPKATSKRSKKLSKQMPKKGDDTANDDDDEEWETSREETTTPTPRKTRSKNPSTSADVQKQNYAMTKHGIMEYVLRNANVLGVNGDKKILKSDGHPYKTSNLEDIVTYLLNKDKKSQFKNHPVGYKEFVEKAEKDAFLKKYLFPANAHQFGSGLIEFKTHKKPANKMITKFKPTLWY